MCGRYTLYQTEHLSDRFNLATKPLIVAQDNYNVAPGQSMPIITKTSHGNSCRNNAMGFNTPLG